ncbi:hypothetical protein [Mesomycoplasma molare]|uniref:Uncharacterized protein n=1 Tax=Mesomycoplasma molare TaxID=171288 RepID=A0ABY5TW34_9BACT|nr:hypothetical protein [Mesomycoplasma molare]UWD34544.1 hypothetical protein NX772_01810 [Mesomycoplasma molare]
MKNLLSFLKTTLLLSQPISVVYNTENTVVSYDKNSQNIHNEEYFATFLNSFNPPDRYKEFKELSYFYKYYEFFAKNMSRSMSIDYEILKRILETNDEVEELPFSKYIDSFPNLKNYENNFQDFELSWSSFFPLFKKEKFNYLEYLTNFLKTTVNDENNFQNKIKREKVFSEYITKQTEDQLLLRVVLLEFEALKYLNEHKDDEKVVQLVSKIINITTGTNPSSLTLNSTLNEFRPIITELRTHLNKNIVEDIYQEIKLNFPPEEVEPKEETTHAVPEEKNDGSKENPETPEEKNREKENTEISDPNSNNKEKEEIKQTNKPFKNIMIGITASLISIVSLVTISFFILKKRKRK